jgi:hypothetical protein
MAIQTALRPIARKIAESVRTFASSQGLPREDFVLVGAWDERTDHIRLFLGTTRQIDGRQWHAGVHEALRQTFADHPWIPMNISLVVQNVRNLDDVYYNFPLAEDEEDLTDLLERS